MKTGYSVDETTKYRKKPKSRQELVEEEARSSAETIEEIQQTGQENRKKGIKAVQEVESAAEEKRQTQKDDHLNKLDSKKRFHNSYQRMLAQTCVDYLQMLEWIRGWRADVIVTDGSPITIKSQTGKFQHHSTKHGILLVVTTPDGRVFHRGVGTVGEPILDYAAMQTLALQMENTMDKERGLLLDSEGDSNNDEIYLPNGQTKSTRHGGQPV